MNREQWDELTNMWGTPDEGTLERVAQFKDNDLLATENYIKEIEQRDAKIRELEQSNIELNKTNMNLILRLTDPTNAQIDEEPSEPEIADVTDLDAFYHE